MKSNIENELYSWGSKSKEFYDRIEEELNVLKNTKVLNELFRLKQDEHILIPAYQDLGGSFVLYILGLNPINPLDFNLRIPASFYPTKKDKNPQLLFYSNSSALRSAGSIQLESLTVLDELKIVLKYLNLSMGKLNKIIEQEKDWNPFISFLDKERGEVALPHFFYNELLKQLIIKTTKSVLSFQELIELIYNLNFIQQSPKVEDEYFKVEIYMDTLLFAYKWWLGGLIERLKV